MSPMDQVRLIIDGLEVHVAPGTTILEAAREVQIYVPTLCYHPDLPPAKGCQAASAVYQGEKRIENAIPHESGKGCGLCVVEVEGEPELMGSCATKVAPGMVVITSNERIRAKRQENLIPILARHRHACLTCAQQEGCSRSECTSNVPENERCCAQFGRCELQDVTDFVGIPPATPKWLPTDLPILDGDPLFVRDYNLCIGCTRCVRACRDLRGIEAIGFVFDDNGEVQIGTLAPELGDSGCKFCTACVEVCPAVALTDKRVRRGKKEEDLVPCMDACPARVDVPEYLRWIARGRRDVANAVILEKVPFPGVLGRVCVHPCEDVCRRGEVNEPISICALKRYAADGDQGLWKQADRVAAETGKKVAVVGGGPAGLTAAFYLRKQGHSVSLFEAQDQAGGMMRYGIPAYRLPRDVLDREIQEILDVGIDFRPNRTLGKDLTLAQLREDGYDGIFLAVGAQLSRRMEIEGSDLPDVLWGVEFLRHIAQGKEVRLKKRVIVIGGGSVAVDAALTARRCGAKEVILACLESREEMPARKREIESSIREGVKVLTSWGPHKILSEKGGVKGVELVRCTRVFDDMGNYSPVFEDTRQTVHGEQVILAIGQAPDISFLEDTSVSSERGLIIVDQETLETDLKGVYAGGDAADSAGTIIHAIAAGRRAAASIDMALGGSGDIGERLLEREGPHQRLGRDGGFALWPREKALQRDVAERILGFQEVELGLSDRAAIREAKRCLQCDLRVQMKSNPKPPITSLPFAEENMSQVPEGEGVYKLFDKDHRILAIRGTADLRRGLLRELRDTRQAAWFAYEEHKMYTQRESELLQQYVQEHGEMPRGGGSDLEDLF